MMLASFEKLGTVCTNVGIVSFYLHLQLSQNRWFNVLVFIPFSSLHQFLKWMKRRAYQIFMVLLSIIYYTHFHSPFVNLFIFSFFNILCILFYIFIIVSLLFVKLLSNLWNNLKSPMSICLLKFQKLYNFAFFFLVCEKHQKYSCSDKFVEKVFQPISLHLVIVILI